MTCQLDHGIVATSNSPLDVVEPDLYRLIAALPVLHRWHRRHGRIGPRPVGRSNAFTPDDRCQLALNHCRNRICCQNRRNCKNVASGAENNVTSHTVPDKHKQCESPHGAIDRMTNRKLGQQWRHYLTGHARTLARCVLADCPERRALKRKTPTSYDMLLTFKNKKAPERRLYLFPSTSKTCCNGSLGLTVICN